jgi:hypothetical protein
VSSESAVSNVRLAIGGAVAKFAEIILLFVAKKGFNNLLESRGNGHGQVRIVERNGGNRPSASAVLWNGKATRTAQLERGTLLRNTLVQRVGVAAKLANSTNRNFGARPTF